MWGLRKAEAVPVIVGGIGNHNYGAAGILREAPKVSREEPKSSFDLLPKDNYS